MRTVTAQVDGVTIAESSSNMFLLETMLRTRYYMPQTMVSFLILPKMSVKSSHL